MRIRLSAFLLLVAAITSCSSRVVVRPATNGMTASANTININTATVEELEKLPYIGRKTAAAIVEFRNENGPFRRVEHILQVRGMSEARFMELRHSIRAE